jgi:hypothetical protein
LSANLANAQFCQAAINVLEFSEQLPEAYGIRGLLRASEYDWKGADSEFNQALEIEISLYPG